MAHSVWVGLCVSWDGGIFIFEPVPAFREKSSLFGNLAFSQVIGLAAEGIWGQVSAGSGASSYSRRLLLSS